ncbi:MAG: glycosyltransferase family 1 protein [Candidatus Levybacteria bacterium]|nr:glycosyltransferase family 1 protein [Candidatus Levybacteria bacterium]
MRIGIDCRLWNESGVGRYTRNLVLNLVKIDRKNTYTLFVLSKDREEILKQVQNDKFQIVKADIRWHTLREQIKFPSILNKENLDLVHFPYFSIPIFYNKPFVITIHDLIINHFPTGKASTLPLPFYGLKILGYKYIIRKAAKNARKIITVSNATKEEIIDHLGVDRDKVVVTYEGVDTRISNFKFKISNLKKPYFLSVGNAYPHKNIERLIDAFSGLRQNDTKLILVGKENFFYKRLKEKVAKMKLEKNILFFGEATDEELSQLYKNALALVMPSLMEGFGLPALEAMENRCLVLASDIPSLKETCGDAAIYFDPYNIKDIARKMEDVYLNNIYYLSEKIKKGFARTKLFSWEKMAKETLNVYNEVLSKS